MLTINTNVSSLTTQNNLGGSQAALATSIQRLSSGLRINSAKDDAAGMAIASRMTAQIGGMAQAVQNANDGISLAQTAEGALQQVTNDLQTMRNLSVQAANGTNSSSDRSSIQASISQLQQDVSSIANNTQFNGLNLLDGSLSNVQFQVGANANQSINASVGNAAANAIGDNFASTATSAGATSMAASTAAAAAIGANGFTTTQLQISGGGQTMLVPPGGASSFANGATAFNIAAQINTTAASAGVPVLAVAHTYAQLSAFSAGSVSLTLQGTPDSAGNAAPVTISASLANATDVTGLAAAINGVSSKTGITAVANTSTGTIALTQSQGYDIGVSNNASSSAAVSISGTDATGALIGTAKALGAGTATNSSTVGGQIDFHSSSSFTIATGSSTAAGVFTAAADATFLNTAANPAAGASALNAISSIDVTKMVNGVPTGANQAMYSVDGAINSINALRAQLGALQNRFSNVQNSLTTTGTNMQAARSRIQDTDYAAETANLTRNQILQQAGTAMLAQANSTPNIVMSLLK